MISVIIPTYNEAACISDTIMQIRERDTAQLVAEIIVADGNSTDTTVQLAKEMGADIVVSAKKGRAAQMNAGAAAARFPVLYFLHADTLPPYHFTSFIHQAVQQNYTCGCFTLAFDYDHWFLKANCWFTRFNVDWIRFGDQSLFVEANLFKASGGFNESHIVMEDQELIKRLKKSAGFTIIKKPVITSARKYVVNGIYKTQSIFFLIFFMYQLGYSQQRLVNTYRKLIRQDKV